MFGVDNQPQRLWPLDDIYGESVVPSGSGKSRSELGQFMSENIGLRQSSEASSTTNDNSGPFKTPGVLRNADSALLRNGRATLPAEKAFAIQIGWRLFRLSGASIMSDSPSYFSTYFEEQVRLEESHSGALGTLFIDRDPDTFADICRHLQGKLSIVPPRCQSPADRVSGYWVSPRDNAHYVKLYADAQFYSLPRLISQLFDSQILVSIGGQQFQVPRDAFTGAGNSSNFFSLGFAGFLSTRDDAFPGLESKGLMRPPPVPPQSVPNRSPQIFADLMQLLLGYSLTIRDADHRADLLSDCKYYGFKGLMHKIFDCDISYNAERGTSEILMRLEDIYKSGVSFVGETSAVDQSPLGGWVNYARPLVDETGYEVIVEIGHQETTIDLRSMRATFYGDTKARISSLFQVVADKMNLPSNLPLGLMMSSGGAAAAPASPANTPLSEDRVRIRIGTDAHILLDGEEHIMDGDASGIEGDVDDAHSTPSSTGHLSPARGRPSGRGMSARGQQPPLTKKRKRHGSLDEFGEWIVRRGQWRMRVQPRLDLRPKRGAVEGSSMEIVLCAVKLDAVSGQRGRNLGRGFLS